MNRYFDANATTRPCDEALAQWSDVGLHHWHNPSGLYPAAAAASRRLEDARESLANLLGCDSPERILFTSGATEANNAVFAHFAKADPQPQILVSAIEHPSVLEPARQFFGSAAELVPARRTGTISPDALREMLAASRPALVSVMAANNETGVLQPWTEIRDLCAEFRVPFHCDAAQWLGKLPASDLGRCGFVTGSAHKFRGTKGVGFLVIPDSSDFRIMTGGPQEQNRRAGTENLAGIAAMVAALESTQPLSEGLRTPAAAARNRFEAKIVAAIPGTLVAGGDAERLWNTSLLVMPDHGNLRWITRLGRLGFEASTGAACSAGKGKPSLTLGAMGFDFDQMGRALRFSAHWDTTPDDWDSLASALISVSHDLASGPRAASPRLNLPGSGRL